MHVMTDNNRGTDQRSVATEPGDRQVKRASPKSKEDPWDSEPAWPGGEYDDDEAVADGMCDDDNDAPPAPRLSAPLSCRQSSLWNEAIARIRALRSSSGAFQ